MTLVAHITKEITKVSCDVRIFQLYLLGNNGTLLDMTLHIRKADEA